MREVRILRSVDEAFRRALIAGAKDGGQHAVWYIRCALEDGPSRKGAAEAMEHFGNELHAKLVMTAMIVDGMEISVPGFKQWLVDTGFGNDLTMIKGFVAWAEYVNARGRVIPDAAIAFQATKAGYA